jgi:hypothetical protein
MIAHARAASDRPCRAANEAAIWAADEAANSGTGDPSWTKRARSNNTSRRNRLGGNVMDLDSISVALLFLVVTVGCFWGGLSVQRHLRDAHRSRDSVDSVRMVITLLVTFAAVVLGLLISSTQARFTAIEVSLRGLSIDISELDQRLRIFGPAADPIRADLIAYTKAVIADTWPEDPPPPGNYPRNLTRMSPGSVESVELTGLLDRIDVAIRTLQPTDDFHRGLATALQNRVTALLDRRLALIENARPSISWPFLIVTLFWLATIFAIAGLSSVHNLLVLTATVLAAASVASSVYLALELDTPLSGFIKVSGTPLRDALLRLTEPPLPQGVQ